MNGRAELRKQMTPRLISFGAISLPLFDASRLFGHRVEELCKNR